MVLLFQTIVIVFCIGYYFYDQKKSRLPFHDLNTKIHKKYHSSILHKFKFNGTYPINTSRNLEIVEPFILDSSLNRSIVVDGINQLQVFIPSSHRFKERYVKPPRKDRGYSTSADYRTIRETENRFYQNKELDMLKLNTKLKYHLWIDERLKMDDARNFDTAKISELFTSHSVISQLSRTLLRQNKKYESLVVSIYDCSSEDVDIACQFFIRSNRYDIQSMLRLEDWESILKVTLSQFINDGYVGGKVTIIPNDNSFEFLLKLGLALEPKVLEEEYIHMKEMKLRETILEEI